MRYCTGNEGLGERSANWMVISHNLPILLALLILANGMFPQYPPHTKIRECLSEKLLCPKEKIQGADLGVVYQRARGKPIVDMSHLCTQGFQKVYLSIHLFIFK